eukprot:1151902-Pelagomonas_calceolata.AAC.5
MLLLPAASNSARTNHRMVSVSQAGRPQCCCVAGQIVRFSDIDGVVAVLLPVLVGISCQREFSSAHKLCAMLGGDLVC